MPHKTWTMRFRVPPYIYTQKIKTAVKRSLFFGGDEDDKSETVLSSDNVKLLALSLKLK